jgi:hypothetical protein
VEVEKKKIIDWIKSLNSSPDDILKYLLEIERIVRYEHLLSIPEQNRLFAQIQKLGQPIYQSGRTAIISDIHGNDKALSIVLENIN